MVDQVWGWDYPLLGADQTFFLIAGPCVIESEEHVLKMAKEIKEVCAQLGIPLFFKASFDKANRTSMDSYRGPGIGEGLRILAKVKQEYNLPILTDIHLPDQAKEIAEVAEIVQIPAFLCRQTDLLVAVAQTAKMINLKKGQFCSPVTMEHARGKIESSPDRREDQVVMLCDRGTMFGYGDLIVDTRSLPRMRMANPGCLIIQDITHSAQQPNVAGFTQGCREMIPTIARATVASGVDGVFMEVHDCPEKALSDKTTQWELSKLKELLQQLQAIHRVTRGREV